MPQSRSRTAAEAQAMLPTDDELWVRRGFTWPELAAWSHLGVNTLSKYLGRRGWKRRVGKIGGWAEAPCEICGEPFAIEPDTGDRRCEEHRCQIGPTIHQNGPEPSPDYKEALEARLPGGERHERFLCLRPMYTVPPGHGRQAAMRLHMSPITPKRGMAA